MAFGHRVLDARRPRAIGRAPDHTKVEVGAVGRHKSLAWRAWRTAREAQPLPLALLDRLWADTLAATALAPPMTAARMFRRSETLMRLLLDQQRWPREALPPPAADPRPKLHKGRHPHWDRTERWGPK
jgi:hypothetical protein